jgi:hypothetical protein
MHRWKDNIKTDLEDGMDWIHLAQARQTVDAHEHGNDPAVP